MIVPFPRPAVPVEGKSVCVGELREGFRRTSSDQEDFIGEVGDVF